jgi:glycosyltransferase involved in cell wall biosynthesis
MAKKKILLLADDLRLPSGIGTISKEFVLKTVHQYDWIQIGAAMKHPDQGKLFDISEDVRKETGVSDASVKIIPYNGYGDRNILFQVIEREKPDAIFHFTDPRYWTWLYALEHELKTRYKLPIIYYSIWDDLPYPMWNAPFYGSCDLIMGISKQSHNIHNEVLNQNGFVNIDLDTNGREPGQKDPWNTVYTAYVPHGLDENYFKPLDETDKTYQEMFKRLKTDNNVDFLVMWNNRNIRRKQPGDVILAFKHFVSKLPETQKNRIALLMHTQIVDGNGTDLRAIWKSVAPECNILFSEQKISAQDLNAMYNVADVVVNIASNEGWGLSNTEALLAGTPTVVNVTGGLQDQCRFENESGDWITFNKEFPTNHTGKYKKHGEWVIPVFPSNRSMQGSPATPYIFDDRAQFEDVGEAIHKWWEHSAEYRIEVGLKGREFCLTHGLTAKQMADSMIKHIDFLLGSPKESRPLYTFNKIETPTYENIGIV